MWEYGDLTTSMNVHTEFEEKKWQKLKCMIDFLKEYSQDDKLMSNFVLSVQEKTQEASKTICSNGEKYLPWS